jgi:hypothetical protein
MASAKSQCETEAASARPASEGCSLSAAQMVIPGREIAVCLMG